MTHPFTTMPKVFEPLVAEAENQGCRRVPAPSEGGIQRWFKEAAEGHKLWWAWMDNQNSLEFSVVDRHSMWVITVSKCPCCDALQYAVGMGCGVATIWADVDDDDVIQNREWVGMGEALTYLRLRRSELLSADTDA